MREGQGIIPVVTASDETYSTCLSVMISTALENSTSKEIHFYVIDDGISHRSKEILKQTVRKYSDLSRIKFLKAEKELYEHFPVSDHITTTAYLRISLPEILNEYGFKKIIYLDADTLVLDDLSMLYATPLHDCTIGAVIDPGQTKALQRLSIQSDAYYFNSGVMLIDTELWQKNAVSDKTIEFIKQHENLIVYHDQDALNAVLYEDWLELDPKWNVQTSLIFERYPAPDEQYKKLYREANRQPSVVHFTGRDKPWNTLKDHPYSALYLNNFEKSLFQKAGDNHE